MIFMKQIKDNNLITNINNNITTEKTKFNSLKHIDKDIYSKVVSCPSEKELSKWIPADEPEQEIIQ